jgi:hypothetical protein
MVETKTICLLLLSLLLLAITSYYLYQHQNEEKKERYFGVFDNINNVPQLELINAAGLQGVYRDDSIANLSLMQGISRNKINNIM